MLGGLLTLRNTLLAVRLHGDMRIEVIESTIGLLATVPAALVHSLNFLVAPTGALVLLRARNGNEAEDLVEQIRQLGRGRRESSRNQVGTRDPGGSHDRSMRKEAGAQERAHLVATALSGRGRGSLVVSEDVVVGSYWSVSITGPVRSALGVNAWVTVCVCHIWASRAVGARLGILVLSRALRRDGRVYGNITVRLDMLGIVLGILMGSAILKIQ